MLFIHHGLHRRGIHALLSSFVPDCVVIISAPILAMRGEPDSGCISLLGRLQISYWHLSHSAFLSRRAAERELAKAPRDVAFSNAHGSRVRSFLVHPGMIKSSNELFQPHCPLGVHHSATGCLIGSFLVGSCHRLRGRHLCSLGPLEQPGVD